jgi:RNA recognition motif-containing protein
MLLYKLFSPFGAVISAKVIVDPQTQASRNYGFVQFRAHSDAKEAVKQLNGLVLGKKTLQISFHNRSSDIWQSSFVPLAPPSP